MITVTNYDDMQKFAKDFCQKLFSEEFQYFLEGLARETEAPVEIISDPKVKVKEIGENVYEGVISLKLDLDENGKFSSEEYSDLIADYFERKYEDFYHRISNMLETFYLITYECETVPVGREEKDEVEYQVKIKFDVHC